MNSPDDTPIDAQEQREWLNDHKAATGDSWTMLAQKTGIAAGTVSVFASGRYAGDNDRVAKEIFRYRQHLATQAELEVEAPEIPGYFETPTSKRIASMLAWAQRGRITVIVTAPGCGKTKTVKHYREAMSNVWLVEVRPSLATLNNMCIAVLAALGEKGARGSSLALSQRVSDRVNQTGGLLVFDEAQHLSEKALEEIRGWHDATGIGLAFTGNEKVLSRMEGGSRSVVYAQLFSRIGMRMIVNLPTAGDARALAEAWNVEDDKQIEFIVKKSQMPGGLRTVTMMMELASMIAASERRSRELADMADAWAQLVSRPLAA